MNKTKIDWADMTWNPVTGCNHGCEYCYARKIANRFGNKYFPYGEQINVLDQPLDGEKGIDPYPFGFLPTLHTYRLADPQKIKKPQTIFVCSMADLFGEWVPDEWIETVFDACERAPQHRYLFLTKNPAKYSEIRTNASRSISISRTLRDQIWLGATATTQGQYNKASSALEDADQTVNTFLSIEPISEPISESGYGIDCFANWVIVGAETGNRKDKVIPEKKWIDDIVQECRAVSVPIFMKESLRELMGDDFIQEFPWEGKS